MIAWRLGNHLLANFTRWVCAAVLAGLMAGPALAETHLSTETTAPAHMAGPRQAADQGGTAAGLAAYENGQFAEALRDWTVAANAGNSNAALYIGIMHDFGHGVVESPAEAYQWYLRAAEGGNAVAMLNLGLLYDSGRGIPQDRQAAAYWYRRAANHGVGRAAYNLGLMYRAGDGVKKDRAAAIRAFEMAEREGVTAARAQLAQLGRSGERRGRKGERRRELAKLEPVVPEPAAPAAIAPELASPRPATPPPPAPAAMLPEAASPRLPSPQPPPPAAIAPPSVSPRPLAQPPAPAAMLPESASPRLPTPQPPEPAAIAPEATAPTLPPPEAPEATPDRAQLAMQEFNQAEAMLTGRGAEQRSQAAELFRRAANKNNKLAQYDLGYCYENGIGVPVDKEQAFIWYSRSANGAPEGVREAAEAGQRKLATELSSAELADAHAKLKTSE